MRRKPKLMAREKFWAWMRTCPSALWFADDDGEGDGVRIYFPLSQDEKGEKNVEDVT
jgi:hypothetical protein